MNNKQLLDLFLHAHANINELKKVFKELDKTFLGNKPKFFYAYTELLFENLRQIEKGLATIQEYVTRR